MAPGCGHDEMTLLKEEILATIRAEMRCEDPNASRLVGSALPSSDSSGNRRMLLCALVLLGVAVWHLSYFLDQTEEDSSSRAVIRACLGQMGNHPIRKYLAYRLDLWFSSNAYSKLIALFYAAILLVSLGACTLYAVSDTSFTDAIWESLAGCGIQWDFAAATERLETHTLRGFSTRIVAIAISIGGMFVMAMLLGIVGEEIQAYVDQLRQGKSDVLESGHTVICGWSDKIFGVLVQLALANDSDGGGVTVILAEMPKEEQEAELAKYGLFASGAGASLGTRIICRQGSPMHAVDLAKVSARSAKSVIILSDESLRPDQSDARSLRVTLSLVGTVASTIDSDCDNTNNCTIVVEMQDVDNEPLVQLVGSDRVETIVAHDLIGRLMVQSARQPGLAQIWATILGFQENEFYFMHHPELVGVTFGEAVLRFSAAIPIGICQDKTNKRKPQVVINPEDDYIIRKTDLVLVLAEDNDSYSPDVDAADAQQLRAATEHLLAQKKAEDANGWLFTHKPAIPAQCVLFCGWRRDMDDIIQVLDDFVDEGSELYVFCELESAEQRSRLLEQREIRKRPAELANLTVHHQTGILCSRRDLEERLPIEKLTSIIILADESDEIDATSKDSQALTTLLLLRDIQSTHGLKRVSSGGIFGARQLSGLTTSRSSTNVNGITTTTITTIAPPNKGYTGGASDMLQQLAPSLATSSFFTSSSSSPGKDAPTDLEEDEQELVSLLPPVVKRSQSEGDTPPPPIARCLLPRRESLSLGDIDLADAAAGVDPLLLNNSTNEPTWSLMRAQADKCAVISEILDSRTCQLIADAGISDYVLSNEIVSMTLAMVAEDRVVNSVLKILMESEGSEFYIRAAHDYVPNPDEPISFRSIMALARRRVKGREIVIGHVRRGSVPVINPPDKTVPRLWTRDDQFIVLADD